MADLLKKIQNFLQVIIFIVLFIQMKIKIC